MQGVVASSGSCWQSVGFLPWSFITDLIMKDSNVLLSSVFRYGDSFHLYLILCRTKEHSLSQDKDFAAGTITDRMKTSYEKCSRKQREIGTFGDSSIPEGIKHRDIKSKMILTTANNARKPNCCLYSGCSGSAITRSVMMVLNVH